ncbi:MAG: PQQ-binding-like beta-propeller repeat protein [Candidatus Altiarchaeales archaeon]|nr:PQQ-binding-like beta-propeller repeat protein [Candidatus Altiarchaeales archaeon]
MSFLGHANFISSPTVVDSGNGFLVIFTTVDGELFVLNSSFSAVWSYGVGGRIVSSPAVSDVEGDGFPEIVVATEEGSVYVFGVETSTTSTSTSSTSTSMVSTSITSTSSSTSTSVVSTSSTSSSSSTTSTTIVLKNDTSSTVVASGGGAPVGGVVGVSVGDAGLFLLFFGCFPLIQRLGLGLMDVVLLVLRCLFKDSVGVGVSYLWQVCYLFVSTIRIVCFCYNNEVVS